MDVARAVMMNGAAMMNHATIPRSRRHRRSRMNTVKQELGACSDEGKVGNVESQLDGEEESIQESRGTEVLDEFHFEPLCSIHKI
jgi:hypothetical protein